MRGVLIFLIAIIATQCYAHLHIIGANYGGRDVTDTVRRLVRGGKLRVSASNGVFGDPKWGTVKTLVIAYRYGDSTPEVACAREGGEIHITTDNESTYNRNPGDITVFGAFYGPKDVSPKFADLGNSGSKVQAANHNFGDPLYGYAKTLCACYEDRSGKIQFKCAWEGQHLYL